MKFLDGINKENLSWALYDWANSAYATTVLAVFFPVFFSEFWSSGADPSVTTARLGIANSLIGVVLMIIAPFLGTMSDISGSKKKYLLLATAGGAVSTAALFFTGSGEWAKALLLYSASSVCFSTGLIFYDALLSRVAGKDKFNVVSSFGYSLGYLGGGILLSVNIIMTLNPQAFGLDSGSDAVRMSFVTVAAWWMLFSIPLFILVKEKSCGIHKEGFYIRIKKSISQISDTFSHIRDIRSVYLFLIAYWLYIDGVDTIIRMAMDFGLSIGLERNSLIKALLITQFVGFPAALTAGLIFKGKDGARKGITISIISYLLITVLGATMTSEFHFYLLAAAVGLVQGGIQALSRSYFAAIIPEDKNGEFFGFYNMIGKFAVILGPLFIAVTGLTLRNMGLSSEAASRGGVMSVAVFFVLGGIIFYMSGRDRQG
jgi:MFS transporter, UMF1 family